MGALHALHATDVLDPSAVCGGLYEMLNSQSVIVDRTGIPGLLGAGERALRKKEEARKFQRDDEMHETARYDDDMIDTKHSNMLTRHEYTRRTRGCRDVMYLKPCDARRGPFAAYGGLTKHMPLNDAIKKGVLLENDGKWVVCCDIRGAAERPEQFDSMIPAMKEQFGEGCEFGECKPRMGDTEQGITFLVQVDKDAPWCRQEAKGQDQEWRGKSGEGGKGYTAAGPTGPTMMQNWEALEATGVMVQPRRSDDEWGREMVCVLRMHPVGVIEGPKT